MLILLAIGGVMEEMTPEEKFMEKIRERELRRGPGRMIGLAIIGLTIILSVSLISTLARWLSGTN